VGVGRGGVRRGERKGREGGRLRGGDQSEGGGVGGWGVEQMGGSPSVCVVEVTGWGRGE